MVWYRRLSLQWRHNGRDSVWNHQPHGCFLNRLFRRRSKKTSKLRVTGLCAGNSPGTGEFPAQMASNAENVSIWWRHHMVMSFGINWLAVGNCTIGPVVIIHSDGLMQDCSICFVNGMEILQSCTKPSIKSMIKCQKMHVSLTFYTWIDFACVCNPNTGYHRYIALNHPSVINILISCVQL